MKVFSGIDRCLGVFKSCFSIKCSPKSQAFAIQLLWYLEYFTIFPKCHTKCILESYMTKVPIRAWGKFVRTNLFRPIYCLFQANILTIEADQLICSAKWLPGFMRTFVGSSLSAGGPMISPTSFCLSVCLFAIYLRKFRWFCWFFASSYESIIVKNWWRLIFEENSHLGIFGQKSPKLAQKDSLLYSLTKIVIWFSC